jgi:hypothetical protein
VVHKFGSQSVYMMPVDCGILGVLDADIHFIGETMTHVYIHISGSVMIDVLLRLSDRSISSIRQACVSMEAGRNDNG